MNNNISTLIENIPSPRYTQTINIVCDSGAYNGAYLYGMLLYVKKLESKDYIKVDKISGSSIGALIGTMFVLNKLSIMYEYIIQMGACYRRSYCLKDFSPILHTLIEELDTDAYKKLNNKMFINYYDIRHCKEIVQCKYTSNEDIERAILNSTFIPFFMNGQYSNNGYIDGFNPYIFNERTIDDNKILFFRLTQYGKIKNMFYIRGELNFEQRIMEGILDIHTFYMNNTNTLFCSWVNEWTLKDYIVFRIRRIIWLCVVFVLYIYTTYSSYIPERIINIFKSNRLMTILIEHATHLYKDLFVLCYNS